MIEHVHSMLFEGYCRHCQRPVIQPATDDAPSRVRWIRCKHCGTAHYCESTSRANISDEAQERFDADFDAALTELYQDQDQGDSQDS